MERQDTLIHKYRVQPLPRGQSRTLQGMHAALLVGHLLSTHKALLQSPQREDKTKQNTSMWQTPIIPVLVERCSRIMSSKASLGYIQNQSKRKTFKNEISQNILRTEGRITRQVGRHKYRAYSIHRTPEGKQATRTGFFMPTCKDRNSKDH